MLEYSFFYLVDKLLFLYFFFICTRILACARIHLYKVFQKSILFENVRRARNISKNFQQAQVLVFSCTIVTKLFKITAFSFVWEVVFRSP